MKQIHIRYFAVFRERRGLGEETIPTTADTAKELYDQLAANHDFPLASSAVRVSVNLEFRPMGTKLQEGDQVAFIPPVAGG